MQGYVDRWEKNVYVEFWEQLFTSFFFNLYFHHFIVSYVVLLNVWDLFEIFPAFLSISVIPLGLICTWLVYITLLPLGGDFGYSFTAQTIKKKKPWPLLFWSNVLAIISLSHFQNRVCLQRTSIIHSENVSVFVHLEQHFECSYENIIPLTVLMKCFLTA